mmetsp:Transcript_59084/g.94037  ORF Transcript_59084/g.94037 Transcript_59084/m.94037 type:complete len:566 (+) Transcript_59084:75-1772(+)|eukprot:CAMPEP_0197024998 /NCGR_PEP_ID=MMETSP1384-20130603/5446_1 /TAXON_ID=29189 /ORGANISM="Ammonia sp." /LENGTH=565 /DNA_ID=CAMNT_0042453475 /DNA_START=144 /DNA_END=1841 /DNA_ORIENTATION=+
MAEQAVDEKNNTNDKPMAEEKKEINEKVKGMKTIWVKGPTASFEADFTKIKQLGNAGQYGITYQCQRKSDGKSFAVKHLNKNRFYRINVNHRHRYLKAMCDEIEILETLKHEYIIKLEAVYEDKTTLYLVMEECTGGELFKRIVDRGKYTEKAAASVIKQMLSALRYMHEDNSIVHCDLKPDNILFLTKDEASPVKIIDFGMSKVLPRLNYLTHLCGTPYYTAPEIIKLKKYNHGCDMWSVGVILFVMIYGYPPFYVDPKQYGQHERRAIYDKICRGFEPVVKDTSKYGYGPWFPDHIKSSPEVRDLIDKLLQKQVRKRYTAREALTHPWIVNRANNSTEDLHKHMVARLVRFNHMCQFKLVIAKIFRTQFYKMRPEHFHQLEQLFIQFDTNNDGVLTFDEFEAAVDAIKELNIDKKHLAQIYEQLATNDDGKNDAPPGIKFSDLLNALVYDYLIACDERLYDAFRKLDDDNDGKITTKQLQEKLKEIDPLGEWDRAIKMIDEQSFDQDGVIDYEEFLLNLHPNFEETQEWIPAMFQKMPSVTFHQKPKEKHKHKDKHKKRASKK